MKYYLISGEASGDLHGSNLIRGIRTYDPGAILQCWGGNMMEAAGATLVKHYRELAFMGFLEVVKNLPTILRNFDLAKKDILEFRPDVLILIDYPGFNLRMAKWAKKEGIRVFYYISPQLWAWHGSRVKTIRECVERMYVILPFEVDWYKKNGVEVDYAGHPLLDVVNAKNNDTVYSNKKPLLFQENKKPIIAILPGSRRQEIKKMLDIMLSVVPYFSDYQFIIAGAPSIEASFYQPFLQKYKQVELLENQTYELLRNATSALVTSGTATLETALFKVPQVVCYRGNAISFALAKKLVGHRIRFIAMPNLIADKEVVKELIQNDLTTKNLKTELENTLSENTRQKILNGYIKIHEQLGNSGASHMVAKMMVERVSLETRGQFHLPIPDNE